MDSLKVILFDIDDTLLDRDKTQKRVVLFDGARFQGSIQGHPTEGD